MCLRHTPSELHCRLRGRAQRRTDDHVSLNSCTRDTCTRDTFEARTAICCKSTTHFPTPCMTNRAQARTWCAVIESGTSGLRREGSRTRRTSSDSTKRTSSQ